MSTILPTDLANLQLWIKADAGIYEDTAGTDAAEDTDGAAYITDHSGNGYHMTQGTSGNRATYRTNQRAGLPVLDFDGTNDYYDHTYTGEPQTVFAVVKVDSNSTHRTLLGADTSDVTDLGSYYFKPSISGTATMNFIRSTSSDDLSASGTSPDVGEWAIIWGRLTTARSISINKWQDESLTYTSGSDTSSASLRPVTSPTFGCGWYAGNRVDFLDGMVGEVIVYSSELTDSEVAKVFYYLWRKWKFGLDINSTPEYHQANFEGTSETLVMKESVDGETWYVRPHWYTPTSGHKVRDPSLVIRDTKWLLAHTVNYTSPSTTTNFDVASSTDEGLTWTFQKSVDCTSITSINRCWAPEWFVDPADDSLHVLFSASTDGGTTLSPYKTAPDDEATLSGTWDAPSAIGGLPTLAYQFDYYELYEAGTYYILFRDGAGGDYIVSYSSSSPFSGFSAHRTGNWLGFGASAFEGPQLFKLNDGTWRFYGDNAGGSFGIYYSDQTAGDWLGGGSTTWSTPTATTVANSSYTPRHGTVCYAPPVPPFDPVWARNSNILIGIGVSS